MSETKLTHKVLIARHSGVTRLTHWINLLAISFLILSGLQIFNAHPALYWGQKATFAEPWLSMTAVQQGDHTVGVTKIGSLKIETTGLFGYSGKAGAQEARGFPAWATIPTYRALVDGRHWHFFFAWLFVINGAVYLAAGLINGHFKKDLLHTKDQLTPAHLWHEVKEHAQLKFPKGDEARRYNAIQKATYMAVIFIILPMMVMTGLTMSPAVNASQPWLVALFGGRQSARTLHFICANLVIAFIIVHVILVLVSGVFNNLRSMITGKYAIEVEGAAK